ncbi:hypothetical protein [Aeromicrobium duanguangcaii]|uniref:hypothetical protein n=1 Tax=Aeromicrobium duanguangcaii TaxID=2968086 RepID=UPI002017E088|nr:hypothetical protein [Aeromicrobium duanguangcaii]MCL3838013.1 hypothetical protein [Aeromicrobium duanguangcaii]
MLLVAVSSSRPVVSAVVPSLPGRGVCMPTAVNNWCAPNAATDPRVLEAARGLESKGWICTIEPRLADRVIFQFRDDHDVEILTFKKAQEAGSEGLGWSQRSCTPERRGDE